MDYRDTDPEPSDSYECCAQWSLLFLNLPLMLIGISFVILGVWSLTEKSYLEALQVNLNLIMIHILHFLRHPCRAIRLKVFSRPS